MVPGMSAPFLWPEMKNFEKTITTLELLLPRTHLTIQKLSRVLDSMRVVKEFSHHPA
jgi:hypothetical protein